jgi:hypothetical protein
MADDKPGTPADVVFRRDEDFVELYANNVRFEPSAWDLKMIFGQLDQSETPNFVSQHTAVSIPWIQAKLCAYFLVVNTVLNAAVNGRVVVPASVVPPRPDPNEATLDEAGKKAVSYVAWVYDQFFGDNPYIPPEPGMGAPSASGTESQAQ